MVGLRKNVKKSIPIYLMLLPGFLYTLINNYIPMAGIVIAFKNIDFRKGIFKSDWCGFDNFKYLFKTKDAFNITRNTICYNLAIIVLGIICAVFVAILLSEIKNKLCVRLYQTVILFPHLISMVIVSYLVFAFLNSSTGLINNLLANFGIDPIAWYSEAKYWPVILVIVAMWKTVGYSSIIYLAAILGISPELYEASRIDGCSKLKEIWYITLPLIKPTVITMALLHIGRIMYSDFGLFYQVPLNSGALIDVTNTIDTYVFRGLMNLGDIGMSSAAGVYQSLVGFALVMFTNYLTRKYSAENALF